MRKLRRQNRKEEIDVDEVLARTSSQESSSSKELSPKAKTSNSQKKVKVNETSVDMIDIQAIQLEFQRKLEALEQENKMLKSGKPGLKKNEEKLLNAIRSEVFNQGTDEPVIGRGKLIKEFKINSKYLDEAIRGLEVKGMIERKQVKYTANIMTNSWKIIEG